MIRICDGEIAELEIDGMSRIAFITAVLSNRLSNMLFLAYENGELLGTLQYADAIGKDCELRDCVQTDKILYDDNAFEQCNIFFKNNPSHAFVPLYNHDGQIIYMAFYEKRNYIQYDVFSKFLSNCLKHGMKYTFYDKFPNMQGFYLTDVNELSYKLYKVLKKEGIPYKLLGDGWELLGEEQYIFEMTKQVNIPDYARLNIYANGFSQKVFSITDSDYYERNDVQNVYRFLYDVEEKNYAAYVSDFSRKLTDVGVKCLRMKYPQAEELQELKEIEKVAIDHKISMEWCDNILDEEDRKILPIIYGHKCLEDNLSGKVRENKYNNVRWGTNVFTIIDEERKNKVYFIGPCISQQVHLNAEETIVGLLQKYLDENYGPIYIVCGVAITLDVAYKYQEMFETLNIRENDMVIFSYYNLNDDGFGHYLDMKMILDDRKEEYWFSNETMHLTPCGSRQIAKIICEDFLKKTSSNHFQDKIVKFAEKLESSQRKGVETYVEAYSGFVCDGKNGAIVMNCNPYTLGHDYLIRTAATQVDTLYVFVVEENKSFFDFSDRYRLVRENCKDIANVIVIPSGQMILSDSTMASYFMKEQNKEIIVDASKDLSIFALGIAPAFNIVKRFVGEEPIDPVTRQYNEAMKEILPHYGIEIIEIPRKRDGDGVISASRVRNAIETKDWELIRKIVPKVTYDFLWDKYERGML